MTNIPQIIFTYIVIVLSAVFHEYAHSYAAYKLGDTTAKDMGRLTINPFKHLDPIGTVILPLLLLLSPARAFIGWAKPVPYNPYNLRDQRYGSLKVGIAGPLANIAIAFVLGLFLRFSGFIPGLDTLPQTFLLLLAFIVQVNIFLALFNLIPVPPLDGSKILMDLFPGTRELMARLGFFGIFIALFVSFYFLSPIMELLFNLIVGGSVIGA